MNINVSNKINIHKIEAPNRISAHIIFAYNHNVDCFISDTPFLTAN